MGTMKIQKWGNSNGIRIPKNVMSFLKIHTNDTILYKTEEIDGTRRIVIEAIPTVEKELTIEELFQDYTGEPFTTELQDLGKSVGNEKW